MIASHRLGKAWEKNNGKSSDYTSKRSIGEMIRQKMCLT